MSATKTCFVIIGYGEKIDLATQRCLNLDRVFENIIKPVFDSIETPKFRCFRAIDENYGGVIEAQMYKWIYEADFVVADISTLNPNVIYELGIRHALRPFSTVVIAEDGIKELPFDISHVQIAKYKHLGEDVGVAEAKRFTSVLRRKIEEMLQKQVCDSPVYTFIQKLSPPTLIESTSKIENEIQPKVISANFSNEHRKFDSKQYVSLSYLLDRSTAAMKGRDYLTALKLLIEAEKRDPTNPTLKQQIILATYKSETPDKESALLNAKGLLSKYLDIDQTLDVRVFQLVGTINKKLAELEYEKGNLCSPTKALHLAFTAVNGYEKAYILSNRHYFNAGNFARVLLLASVLETDLVKKYRLFIRSYLTWEKVYEITKNLLSKNGFGGKKLNVLEKHLEAKAVLNNGIEDDEMAYLKTQLQLLQSEFFKHEFDQRYTKSIKYVRLIRSSLQELPKDKMII